MRVEQGSGWSSRRAGLIWLVCALAALGTASAATETVIHSFATFPLGANPYAPPTGDASGDLYGTTYQGGGANLAVQTYPRGTESMSPPQHQISLAFECWAKVRRRSDVILKINDLRPDCDWERSRWLLCGGACRSIRPEDRDR